MHLLELDENGYFGLTKDLINDIPLYAILSHTWEEEDEEITFEDLMKDSGKTKITTAGYRKIRFCGEQAARDGLRYFWVDTCCIDKSNNTELVEAINSMFQWYRKAAKCYVYLSDVSTGKHSLSSQPLWKGAFRQSRWFTRGWTLQELIAPPFVEFFSRDGKRLGDKKSLEFQIHEITGIPVKALQGSQNLSEFSVTERIAWAEGRETTRKEDRAYSILGIFDISMPLIYGEGGEKALKRLREEVGKVSRDKSISQAHHEKPKDEPSTLFMLPFPRDELFVGREDALDQIARSVRLESATKHSRMALVGLGGIGKSQIAIEYAHRARSRLPGLTVIWIHASTPSRFEQGYRDFARNADIKGRGDPAIHLLELVRDWLSDEANGQWLMLLDNVDNDDDWFLSRPTLDNSGEQQRPLEVFLPQSPNGTILVTSRSSTAARKLLGDYGKPIYVERMPERDALALLNKKISDKKSPEEDARALVHTLDGIPLAITQAAAYIRSRERFDVSKYLQIFQENETNMVSLMNNEDAKHDLRRDHSTRVPVLKTLHITIDKIRETKPKSAEMLALMSMFDRQEIPKYLFDDGMDALKFEETIAPLLSYSLVHQQTQKDDFGMHRLVQLATRAWLGTQNEVSKWQSEAIRILANAFPAQSILLFENWPLCQALLPHAKELVARNPGSATPIDALNTAKILKSSAWYLLERIGEYKGAEKNLRDAVELCEDILGVEHEMTIECLGALASVLRIQGELVAAETLVRQALQRSEINLGPNHTSTAKAQFRLGLLLARKKEYGEAEAMQRRAQSTFIEKCGWEHSDTLLAVADLASVLASQRKYSEAETLLRMCMKGMEVVLGEEHPDTLIYRNRLAQILEDQCKYAESEVLYRRTIEIRERTTSLGHPRTLGEIRSLVRVLEKQEKHDEAAPWKPKADEAIQKGYDDSI
ncbi:hypothetical protein GP486_002873 [Trichoglossum hirsutum]|uniref:HET-domain-containing protein n=1 Tax=Trichoglossum hirsutum TaxID=265104 RepID=A0A9P8LDJ8_9PEZI|nr:hypothetical protein GP486_002873 [Trichoglossum hirsutum]